MNSFTKKAAKAMVSTVVLGGLLFGTTACNNNSDHPAESAPTSPAVSQSATPSAAPTESKAPVAAGPLGVDIDEVIANRIDSGVYKTFPNETPASLKEGVTFALSTYEHLVNIQNFYQKRTGNDNDLLFPDAAKFKHPYYEAMTARTTASGGQLQDIITFGKDGGIGKDAPADKGGVEHYIKDGAQTKFTSGQPRVIVNTTENDGDFLLIEGPATLMAPTSDNKLVTISMDYRISITHAGDHWVITELGRHIADVTFTDSVAAPKAPNGK